MGFYDTDAPIATQPTATQSGGQARPHRQKSAYPPVDFVEAGHRYYEPVLGRWPSRDPIGELGGLHLYAFVRNRSLNAIDPDGRLEVPIPGDPLRPIRDIIGEIEDAIRLGRDIVDLIDRLAGAIDTAINDALAPIEDLGRLREGLEDLRRQGHDRFPGHANSCMRHCWGSCEAKKRYGEDLARLSGIVNEIQGLIRWDIPRLWDRLRGRSHWAFSFADFADNELGLGCADHPTLDCEACCDCECNRPPPGPVFPFPLPVYPPDRGNHPPVIIIGPLPDTPGAPSTDV